jgi:hypothetical protein
MIDAALAASHAAPPQDAVAAAAVMIPIALYGLFSSRSGIGARLFALAVIIFAIAFVVHT